MAGFPGNEPTLKEALEVLQAVDAGELDQARDALRLAGQILNRRGKFGSGVACEREAQILDWLVAARESVNAPHGLPESKNEPKGLAEASASANGRGASPPAGGAPSLHPKPKTPNRKSIVVHAPVARLNLPADERQRELVESHLHLARKAARAMLSKLKAGRVTYDELLSAAYEGLIGAAKRFEPSRGFTFATYATHRIRGAIIDWTREQDHLPRKKRLRTSGLAAKRAKLSQELGREPSTREVAEAAGVSESQAMQSIDAPASLETITAYDETGRPQRLWKLLADVRAEAPDAPTDGLDALRLVCRGLDKRQRLIVIGHYWLGETMKQCGQQIGVGESRASQMHKELLQQIKERVEPPRLTHQPESCPLPDEIQATVLQIHAELGTIDGYRETLDELEQRRRERERRAAKFGRTADVGEMAIAELDLDDRIINALDRQGLIWVKDLKGWPRERLLAIGNFSGKCLSRLEKALAKVGVQLERRRRAPGLKSHAYAERSA